jgi:hypothetical protein
LSVETLFLAIQDGGAGSGDPLDARPEGDRLVTLTCPAGGLPTVERCRAELDALPRGSYLALVIDLSRHGRVRRASAYLALPFLVKRSETLLTRCGADLAGRYGVFPDVGSPTILYQLGGTAAAYAEARLLPAAGPGPVSLLLAVLSRWADCDTSLGSVIVIGRKP